VDVSGILDMSLRFTSLEKDGFLNYFEVDDNGSKRDIGCLLLSKSWKKAINALLAPQSSDNEDVTAARTYWRETRGIRRTLAMLPASYKAERAMLQFFMSTQRTADYLGAILAIPGSLRLMYIHDYTVKQSIYSHCSALSGTAC